MQAGEKILAHHLLRLIAAFGCYINHRDKPGAGGSDAQPIIKGTPRPFAQFPLHDRPDSSEKVVFEYCFKLPARRPPARNGLQPGRLGEPSLPEKSSGARRRAMDRSACHNIMRKH